MKTNERNQLGVELAESVYDLCCEYEDRGLSRAEIALVLLGSGAANVRRTVPGAAEVVRSIMSCLPIDKTCSLRKAIAQHHFAAMKQEKKDGRKDDEA